MERNYGAEIDGLKNDLSEIKRLLQSYAKPEAVKNENAEQTSFDEKLKSDPHISEIFSRLEDACRKSGQSGAVTYMGVYASGRRSGSVRESKWLSAGRDTDELLSLIENKTAEKVLACIGSGDRLNILLNIMKKPMTVAQLVEECGYNSTGQVYHHLKPLIAADLIYEDPQNEGRGVYAVRPHRVQGIVMLLAGIGDMLDTKYTRGEWEASQEA